jgi:gamma-glutamyl hercynylcysteine S-oxide synthase
VRADLVEHVPRLPSAQPLLLLAEHDLMHVETLYYMLAQLAAGLSTPQPCPQVPNPQCARSVLSAPVAPVARPDNETRWISVPPGLAVIGLPFSSLAPDEFVWDNELTSTTADSAHVPPFLVANLPVTVGQYARFVRAGGYSTRRYWKRDDDWNWVNSSQINCPASWRRVRSSEASESSHPAWAVLTVDGLVDAEGKAVDWPVSVSLAEARAYAVFAGARLLTESEWDRVAFGNAGNNPRAMPWGPPHIAEAGLHGNFGLVNQAPVPVGSFPHGASWVGALDLVGNGWELVDTVFAPLDGFLPTPLYPEYSLDFFDGNHYVLKGASWATDASLVRRSFRNFYQPHYACMFCQFRLARNIDGTP